VALLVLPFQQQQQHYDYYNDVPVTVDWNVFRCSCRLSALSCTGHFVLDAQTFLYNLRRIASTEAPQRRMTHRDAF
jgi:hypothetical protein